MKYKNLILEIESNLAIVTVNRPEVRNILNTETWREFDTLVTELSRNQEIRVVIITGSGSKAFIAGADLTSLKERTALETFWSENQSIMSRFANIDKVTIAAINGFALGGGCELALACDLRIAAETARLGLPELNLSMVPGAGGTQRLSRLVGPGKAKELIFTADIITAQEALTIGLVNKVVPANELMKTAREMAAKIIAKGPLAVKVAKSIINWGGSTDLNSGLIIERLGQAVLFGTEDRLEGINAFLEKRPPNYKGK